MVLISKPDIFIYYLKLIMFKLSMILSIAFVLFTFCPNFAFSQVIDSSFAQRSAVKEKLRERQ
jgi:hypothetical protein